MRFVGASSEHALLLQGHSTPWSVEHANRETSSISRVANLDWNSKEVVRQDHQCIP